MVAVLAGEGDEFEEALLEWLQADLERAQHHVGAGLGGYGAGAELVAQGQAFACLKAGFALAVVEEEVAAVAIGLEHGVARRPSGGCRRSDPLEPLSFCWPR